MPPSRLLLLLQFQRQQLPCFAPRRHRRGWAPSRTVECGRCLLFFGVKKTERDRKRTTSTKFFFFFLSFFLFFDDKDKDAEQSKKKKMNSDFRSEKRERKKKTRERERRAFVSRDAFSSLFSLSSSLSIKWSSLRLSQHASPLAKPPGRRLPRR